jgi:flagellar biosynthesis/type III secretory pathway protein FliH
MDLEEIGMSAFSVELLKSLAEDAYEKGRSEGFDKGFTAALYSIVFAAKKKSVEEAIKAAESFLNGPFADKDAKAKCDELAEMGLDS